MHSLFYHFSWNDTRILIANGTSRRDGAIEVAASGSLVALYGPYVPLTAGNYRAVTRFRRPCTGTAYIEVCIKAGTYVLARRLVPEAQIAEDAIVSIEFSLSDAVTDLEIRVSSVGSFVGGVESVRIVGEPRDAPWHFTMEDLHEVGIDKALSRGRSLYDGYRRGVSLQFADAIRKIRADADFQEAWALAGQRTIIGDLKLANLFLLIKFYLPRLDPGHITEFGCYRGGGAIFMAALARKFLPGCKVFGFDTFAGMPITDRRVDGHREGAFGDVDLRELRRYVGDIELVDHLEFVQGDFADTAKSTLAKIGAVSLAHIDCDIRSAVECAYDTARPHMVSGGYWILDDPLTSDCLGAAEAMEDLLIRRDRLNSEQLYPHCVFRQP